MSIVSFLQRLYEVSAALKYLMLLHKYRTKTDVGNVLIDSTQFAQSPGTALLNFTGRH